MGDAGENLIIGPPDDFLGAVKAEIDRIFTPREVNIGPLTLMVYDKIPMPDDRVLLIAGPRPENRVLVTGIGKQNV